MTKKYQKKNNDVYLPMSNMEAKFIHFKQESDVKFNQFHKESEKIFDYLKDLVASILINAPSEPEKF